MIPDSEEWPDEPDEPDPEARWGHPEDDLASIPSIEEPGAGADPSIEVDGDIAKYFWVAVIYANVALGGVSIGLMLVVFRGQYTLGGGAVVVGLFALYRTYDLYQTYQTRVADDDAAESGEDVESVETGNGASSNAESVETSSGAPNDVD
ncbi:MAG: hypothetical protein ABEI27_11430 [Halobellus sp.]|uniref:DUF7322 domain-containing protein n=1 Tax=Halobellus sp. TaxID=1979212 RepID=UPI0035D49CC6